jgi:hypothetical protein
MASLMIALLALLLAQRIPKTQPQATAAEI